MAYDASSSASISSEPAISVDDLREELKKLSAEFHQPEGFQDIAPILRSLVRKHRVQRAIYWKHPLLCALKIDELLREAGVDIVTPEELKDDFPRCIADVDLGITAVDAVSVEEGALLMRAKRGQERSVSLLPPLHLAVATQEHMVKSVRDLICVWRGWLSLDGRLPSAFHLICGPSRTADIEMDLVLGVHGSKVLYVLFVDFPP